MYCVGHVSIGGRRSAEDGGGYEGSGKEASEKTEKTTGRSVG